MARKKYDMAVKVGTYQKDGQEKNRYQNIGAVIEGDTGLYILLDRYFNPAGIPNPDDRSNVIVSLFEPRDRDGSAPQTGARPSGGDGDGFKDDIPF